MIILRTYQTFVRSFSKIACWVFFFFFCVVFFLTLDNSFEETHAQISKMQPDIFNTANIFKNMFEEKFNKQ